jgi:thymidine kinase
MRSRKTSELRHRILSIVLAGNQALVIRPKCDQSRWQTGTDEKHPNRVTHDGQGYLPIELEADHYARLAIVWTEKLMDQIDFILKSGVKEVVIDELQFFEPKDAFDALQTLAKHKISATIAGLNLDYKRELLPTIIKCYGLFTQVEHRYASCAKCGNQANFTSRLDKSNQAILQVGDKEYESRCHECFV